MGAPGLMWQAFGPVKAPPVRNLITGVTRDVNGANIGGVTVTACETISPTSGEPKGAMAAMTVSDSVGNFSLEVHSRKNSTFRLLFSKADNPEIVGTSNTDLTGTLT